LLVPSAAALIGMLMLGNLFRECGVTPNLSRTAGDAMMFITVICIGITVGATASAEAFLNSQTLGILCLGLVAFAFSTFGGILFGNIMCSLSGGKINPLIGSAGVSAVPMAARVSQKVGSEVDPFNFLLMHAMGPNVAGCIGTAVAAGVFLTIYQ
jgi:oxaloacetate decarboxylase beta subunit